MKPRIAEIPHYTTLDGSRIRELMHPARRGNRAQSLAEATVRAGASTRPHRHRRSGEIYHILSASGPMTLGEERIPLGPGDTLWIPPGTPHCIRYPQSQPLVLVCACAPAYSQYDTEVL